MSQIYIPGIIENIKSDSTPYSPIIEAISNSIDAINEAGRNDGQIDIVVARENTLRDSTDTELPKIISVNIKDNGIGFNNKNRGSFDTIYSPKKKDIGGKGFGRFFYLKHFTDVSIESYFLDDDEKIKKRTFDVGKDRDVVVNESVEDTDRAETGATLYLKNLRQGSFDRDTELFAHRILEQLLSHFVDDNLVCPRIAIHDDQLDAPIILNELIGDSGDSLIQIIDKDQVTINDTVFKYKLFKLYKMRTQKSRIVLTARNQSVTDVMLEDYVPEFTSDFIDEVTSDNGVVATRNFIIRFYVQSQYLDDNVTTERDNFNFSDKNRQPSIFPISKEEIEEEIANIAKEKFAKEFKSRFEKKKQRYEAYATENVWYKPYVKDLDFEKLKAVPSNDELETILHKTKYNKDLETKQNIKNLTSSAKTYQDAEAAASEIIKNAKEASLSDLSQYVAFRKAIIELLKTSIRYTLDGTYKTEKELHDIIFPTRSSSEDTSYDGHNLWVLDERLTFTSQYISSDKPIFKDGNKDRPDIAVFHNEIAYRETNESHSPISIFEFKKPGRHDFTSKSSEDPIDQIIRYVQAIKKGELKTIEGVEVRVGQTTPFYGYIVADIDNEVKDMLMRKGFKVMPDGKGWFLPHDNFNLHIEYLTWQKLIDDAEIRHKKFFDLLGA